MHKHRNLAVIHNRIQKHTHKHNHKHRNPLGLHNLRFNQMRPKGIHNTMTRCRLYLLNSVVERIGHHILSLSQQGVCKLSK